MKMSDYVKFIPWQERAAFYSLMERASVFLDTIGFSGFNTAMQAVECCLPIVTREGAFLRGRFASGILRRIGITELIADSDDEYVALAVRIIRDTRYHQDLQQRIASNRQVLFDDLAPVQALADFFKRVTKKH